MLTEFLGHRSFHHAQRLAELHRTALELTEHGEQLLGGLLVELSVDLGPIATGQPPAEADGGSSGDTERNLG
ncbi:Uncharacterised protein [Mycobacteroides abscessus subsp. abscessus]|nr:Uncharacterised protein [Mycobacteroides abscessus subsp. abscessus]